MKKILLTLLAAGLVGSHLPAATTDDATSLDEPKTLEETASKLVSEFDEDGDNALSLDEFKDAVAAHQERSTDESAEAGEAEEMSPMEDSSTQPKADLEVVFARSDIDASGSLNQSETVYALEELRPSVEVSAKLP